MYFSIHKKSINWFGGCTFVFKEVKVRYLREFTWQKKKINIYKHIIYYYGEKKFDISS